MAGAQVYKLMIAETAPVILTGFSACLKKIQDIHLNIIEVNTKADLFDTLAQEKIDLLLVNPAFGGLLHPEDVRKKSLNRQITIFAIEISKLTKSTLSLYDNHIHITDDLEEIKSKIKSVLTPSSENIEEKETLSLREKEIISYVVKGYTNQEMADKLFISVHTVMTHRRNIARKLQIHSATGLTIYAIVNKIVDLSEIKL